MTGIPGTGGREAVQLGTALMQNWLRSWREPFLFAAILLQMTLMFQQMLGGLYVIQKLIIIL